MREIRRLQTGLYIVECQYSDLATGSTVAGEAGCRTRAVVPYILLHTLKHFATLCDRPSRHRVACLVSCMRPRVFASLATDPAVAGEAKL